MKHYKLDPMTILLVVVALGVALTMVAQAAETAPPSAPVVAYQSADLR